jgi:hypothetical protein
MQMDYVPQVTRDDVLRVIRRDFSSHVPDEILRLLDEYGTQSGHSGKDRVHLAILKLSNGNIGRLRQSLEAAKTDFRDVICPAEYPKFWELGLVRASQLSREDVEQLKKDDWEQYEEWLNHG